MHYKNSRPAKVGDKVLAIDYAGIPFAGIVVNVNEQSAGSGCALQILTFNGIGMLYFDAAACLRIEDVQPAPYDPSTDPDSPLSLEIKAGNNAAALVAAHVVAMGAAGAQIPVKLPDGSLFTVSVVAGVQSQDTPSGLYGSVKEPGLPAMLGTNGDGNNLDTVSGLPVKEDAPAVADVPAVVPEPNADPAPTPEAQ